ncbi:MAG: efflux RND transporter periplasmic adaptor subunit [Mariprofundales bacterium]
MNKQIIITAIITLCIGAGIGYFGNIYFPTTSTDGQKDIMIATDNSTKKAQPVFYRNPMNPAITSPMPAQDEMGMDYIPVYANDANGTDNNVPTGTVSIDGILAQNIGVRTTTVVKQNLARDINSIGRVTFDEQRVARLHPKYDGWVERLFIDKTGDQVSKNTMLMAIYSPQLVASQEEYILALNNVDMLKNSPFPDVRNGAQSLLRSARARLELLDVPKHQLDALKRDRKVKKSLHLHSPFTGIVMQVGAREGERITPTTELYMIADLTRVWVIVDLYDDDLPWVRAGDEASMTVAGVPGRVFNGKVSYIYPYLEAKTRTVKLRLEFDNPNLTLKPEMFANVKIKAGNQVDAIVVPAEAIIRTGESEQVFVQRAMGKFAPRKVTLGVTANDMVQITNGLKEGEIVVTSSQFLIDSESKLKEATAKMMDAIQPENNEMDMGAMDIDDMDMGDMK